MEGPNDRFLGTHNLRLAYATNRGAFPVGIYTLGNIRGSAVYVTHPE